MLLKIHRFLGMTTIAALALGLCGRDLRGEPAAAPAPGGDAPVGWATAEGGTSGGRGGPVVTASDAGTFLAAVRGDALTIVRVPGTIRLPQAAHVGSNKTILGLGSDAT